MTTLLDSASVTAPFARRPIVTRALLVRFVSIIALSFSYFLPLAAIPVFTSAIAGGGAAGFTNGALLISTVVGEIAAPWILALTGYRAGLALGLFLLGAPALALLVIPTLPAVVLVCAARGFGFGLAVVAGGALTAAIVPQERRGEALAMTGVVSGIPSLVAMPLGVWLAYHGGLDVVFLLTAVAPLAAIVSLHWLPSGSAPVGRENGMLSGLRDGGLMRPAAVFAISAAAAGAFVTYLPLAVDSERSWLASAALFVQPTCTTVGIWIAGRLSDRHPRVPLLAPAIFLGAVGMAALAAVHSPASVLAGAVAFGLAFGILDNATVTR
ncbi:MAG TPA: MFS transporter, partial [Pseudolysinimonas sp.]